MRKQLFRIAFFTTLMGTGLSSCMGDFLNGEDKSYITSDDIKDIENLDPDALVRTTESLLLGIYSYTTQSTLGKTPADFGLMSLYHLGDIMTDDMAMHTQGSGWYTFDYSHSYWSEEYVRTGQYWTFFYTIINKSNDLLNKIAADTQNSELKAIMGQCYALRGFSYFYLAQMFQQTYVGNEDKPGMPIYLTKDEGESVFGRAPLREVYARIDSDFARALQLLEGWTRKDKVHIDETVASGLYARVCLVKHDWDGAIKHAQFAKNKTQSTILTTSEMLKEGFNNINSAEWMWGADITNESTTQYASFFSFVCSYDAGYGGDVGSYRKIDRNLFSLMGNSDVRKNQFKDPTKGYSGKEATFPPYTNLKFKKVQSWEADYVYMRKAEMILIEAEAYAQKEQRGQASIVLKELMINRDPSWSSNSVSVDDVFKQRRIELWGEGFSLFDHQRLHKGLDRTYSGSNHLTANKYKIAADSWFFFYQIPITEIQNNSSISQSDQNPAPLESEKEQ